MAINLNSAIYVAVCVTALMWTTIPKVNAFDQTESWNGDITDSVVTEPTNAYDVITLSQDVATLKSIIGNLQSQLSQTQGTVAGKFHSHGLILVEFSY